MAPNQRRAGGGCKVLVGSQGHLVVAQGPSAWAAEEVVGAAQDPHVEVVGAGGLA